LLGGLSLVEWIGQNLQELIPFSVIPVYARGVRMFFGKIYNHEGGHPWTGELGPGLWLKIPWIWPVEVIHVVPQVVNLPTQTITTKDGQPLSFSANIEFEIFDAAASWTKVQSIHSSVAFLCMSHMARKLRDRTMAEALEGGRDLERSLASSLSTRLNAWGVRVTDVGLSDMVKSRTFRLYGDVPTIAS